MLGSRDNVCQRCGPARSRRAGCVAASSGVCSLLADMLGVLQHAVSGLVTRRME